MKRLKLSATILLMFGLSTFINAQEAVASAGGDSSGSGGSVSYTIGQVFYGTTTGLSGITTEGVQQPCEILVVTGIDDAKDIDLGLSAYPNPTTDHLTLKVTDYDSNKLSYHLYDVNGKLIENKEIVGDETLIRMTNLESSIYILKVTDKNKVVKTFKIIKK